MTIEELEQKIESLNTQYMQAMSAMIANIAKSGAPESLDQIPKDAVAIRTHAFEIFELKVDHEIELVKRLRQMGLSSEAIQERTGMEREHIDAICGK